MLKEELHNFKTNWSNFLSIKNWWQKIKNGSEKLVYTFFKMASPAPLLLFGLIAAAVFFIVISIQNHLPENLFQDIEISLEIATSISIFLAMIIFVVTTILENNRQSKARRQDFKITKLNRLTEYIIDKKPSLDKLYMEEVFKWDSLLDPMWELQEKLQNIRYAKADALYRYDLDEENLSEDELNLLSQYSSEEQLEYDKFLIENGEQLLAFYYSLCTNGFLPKGSKYYDELSGFSYHNSFSELKSLFLKIEEFISEDPMMKWSIGEKTTEKIQSELQELKNEFQIRTPIQGNSWQESKKKQAYFDSQLDAIDSLEDKINFVYQEFSKKHKEVTFLKKTTLDNRIEIIEQAISYCLTKALSN